MPSNNVFIENESVIICEKIFDLLNPYEIYSFYGHKR